MVENWEQVGPHGSVTGASGYGRETSPRTRASETQSWRHVPPPCGLSLLLAPSWPFIGFPLLPPSLLSSLPLLMSSPSLLSPRHHIRSAQLLHIRGLNGRRASLQRLLAGGNCVAQSGRKGKGKASQWPQWHLGTGQVGLANFGFRQM